MDGRSFVVSSAGEAYDFHARVSMEIPNQNSTWRQMMKRLFAGLRALALLFLIPLLLPVQAQTAAVATGTAGPFSYDVTQEVTLSGTVSGVLTRPSQGMIM